MKTKKPTLYQSRVLQQIARSRLVKTFREGKAEYHVDGGREISDKCAETLINNGWVKPESPGLFPSDPQSYRALKP